MADTQPAESNWAQSAPHLTVAPAYTAPDGSVYVHHDLAKVVDPWSVEAHIGPVRAHESFGDVESWAAYVLRYAEEDAVWPAFLTWSEKGLRAVLDYHSTEQEPNRCQWTAEHPFVQSLQYRKWAALANGVAKSQRDVLEAFEDLGPDIVEPTAADLVSLVRVLRATSNASANTELRPDGTTFVNYTKNQTVHAGEATLPPSLTIAIPVLKGHTEAGVGGKLTPVLYRLTVRIRVSVDDNARLAFRLSMPDAERTLEAAYADRVDAARLLLGEAYALLRAS